MSSEGIHPKTESEVKKHMPKEARPQSEVIAENLRKIEQQGAERRRQAAKDAKFNKKVTTPGEPETSEEILQQQKRKM
jgi:hypothetical protein